MKLALPTLYPDVRDILARKAEGRRALAALTFAEKIAILEALRAHVEPIRRAREMRRAQPAPVSRPTT